ncbi:MAG TPA: hypothetical protein VLF68_02045 [Candidatus Saccharimonadales bacterium]|nr:hypothetical protein [Candidatus Saccharimonadales bacterium]
MGNEGNSPIQGVADGTTTTAVPVPPPAEVAQPAAAEAPATRLTAADAERAKAEKEAAFTTLMDDMEASVEAQGQYFVKLGQKKPITETRPVTTSKFMGMGKKTTDQETTVGYDDDRALILRAPIDKEVYGNARTDFIVVTPDGFRIIPFYKNDIDNPQSGSANYHKRNYDMVVALTSGTQTPDGSSRYGTNMRSTYKALVSDNGFDTNQEGKAKSYDYINLEEPDKMNIQEDFQSAVDASIRMTESPHRQHVEEATKQTQVATQATSMIRNLPPRP